MSIGASVASFEYGDRKINLIDTPGEPSFVADTLGALRVVDAAVVVVNAVMGVEVHTERLWSRAAADRLARLLFVNMLDRERADFFRALDSLKEAFGPHVVATEIPIGSEHEVRGVIDLIDMKAFEYSGKERGNATESEIPDDLRARAEEYREKLMDEVAENSDELMERYLEGRGDLPRGDRHGAQEGRHGGAPVPGHLRRGDQEPRHEPPPGGAGRGCSLAGDAGRDQGARRRWRGDRDRAGRRRRARRLRVQDHRRPLHGADQPAARLLRRPALGLAGLQRHPQGEGADRSACRRRAARRPPPWTSSAPATSARSPSCARRVRGTCSPARTRASRSRHLSCRRR